MPKRIMITGCSGTGKSTLAHRLAQKTGLPLIHLDQHYWRPNWVEPSITEWRATISQLILEDQWLMDGNYSGTWDLRIPRAQRIIYLDYPLWITLPRVLKRVLKYYGQNRPDMAAACPERFSLSFLWMIINFRWTRRERHLQGLATAGDHCEVLIFRSPKALRNWIKRTY